MIRIIILPAGVYFMAAMLDLRHLGPSGPTKFVSHRIPLIRKDIGRHYNMGRIGIIFIF